MAISCPDCIWKMAPLPSSRPTQSALQQLAAQCRALLWRALSRTSGLAPLHTSTSTHWACLQVMAAAAHVHFVSQAQLVASLPKRTLAGAFLDNVMFQAPDFASALPRASVMVCNSQFVLSCTACLPYNPGCRSYHIHLLKSWLIPWHESMFGNSCQGPHMLHASKQRPDTHPLIQASIKAD
jgi:hypothetical protein